MLDLALGLNIFRRLMLEKSFNKDGISEVRHKKNTKSKKILLDKVGKFQQKLRNNLNPNHDDGGNKKNNI